MYLITERCIYIHSTFLSKPSVSLFIGSWTYSFKIDVCFCVYAIIEVYEPSNFFCVIPRLFLFYVAMFRNIELKCRGITQKKGTTFTTWWKFEIKNTSSCLCKNVIIIMYCCIKLRIRNESDKVAGKNRNTHFIFRNLFPWNRVVYKIMWKNSVISEARV
jgi:hypothetical protein